MSRTLRGERASGNPTPAGARLIGTEGCDSNPLPVHKMVATEDTYLHVNGTHLDFMQMSVLCLSVPVLLLVADNQEDQRSIPRRIQLFPGR